MGECAVCHSEARTISRSLGLCSRCILDNTDTARTRAIAAHTAARRPFGLPPEPLRAPEGLQCRRCFNRCTLPPGAIGFCGVRRNLNGRVDGGNATSGAVQWYHDPLPTNCVADWVCPASGPAGYGRFTDTPGPEYGYFNLAVFYEACSFDCLFCQNWHFRRHSVAGPRHSSAELAAAAGQRTRCICFFGGDPSCQARHALSAARLALEHADGRIMRICWETNGSMDRSVLKEAAKVSLESGGCIKVDLKAWDDALHRALCGVTNRRTLDNFEFLSRWIARRPNPPFLVASTLLVPGYIDARQVEGIARFIAQLDPTIPYALLAFHPAFEMSDLPTTPRRQAADCLAAAQGAGLTRVRLGNVHLLS